MAYKFKKDKNAYNRKYQKEKYHNNPDEKAFRIAKAIAHTKQQISINKEWYIKFKKSLKCATCGFSHPAALQFHHIDSVTKKHEISKMVASGHSLKTILLEVAKCEVLCANCHQIKHWSENYI